MIGSIYFLFAPNRYEASDSLPITGKIVGGEICLPSNFIFTILDFVLNSKLLSLFVLNFDNNLNVFVPTPTFTNSIKSTNAYRQCHHGLSIDRLSSQQLEKLTEFCISMDFVIMSSPVINFCEYSRKKG